MPDPMMQTAGAGAPPSPMAEDASPPKEQNDGMASVFIPKDALSGREYKKGDTLELTVKDVDPETGEVEAECKPDAGDKYSNGGSSGKRPGYEEAIDAMPEEKD